MLSNTTTNRSVSLWMRLCAAWAAFAYSLSVSVPVLADQCAEQVELHPRAVKLDDTTGLWLPPPEANRVLFVLGTCVPNYMTMIDRQQHLIGLQHQMTSTSSRALDLMIGVANFEHQRAELFRSLYRQQSNETSFFDSPVLWGIVGVILGVGFAYGAVELSSKVK